MGKGIEQTRRLAAGLMRAGERRFRRRAGSDRLLLVPLLLVAGCASLPFGGDSDATSEGARPLALGEAHSDELRCQAEGHGDCQDWFEVQLEARAQLRIDLKTTQADEAAGAAPALTFVLEAEDGKELRRRGPGASLRTRRSSDPGLYRIRVEAGTTTGPVAYELTVRELELALRRWAVLDAEPPGENGRRRVLIAGGSDDGLKVGFVGRLVAGDRTLAQVRVIEVYPEGALVETRGQIAGPLSESSEAEIELPPGR